jgi:hypothetical protein
MPKDARDAISSVAKFHLFGFVPHVGVGRHTTIFVIKAGWKN